MTYTEKHLRKSAEILQMLDVAAIEKVVESLAEVKASGGRLFFLGVGGSAANCSHAVNDFRQLTARINDDGWESVFVEWLKVSRFGKQDALFIFSVGGGSVEKNISPNLVAAAKYAKSIGAKVIGILGRDGGFTGTVAEASVIVPTVNPETITPHSEAFQAVIWHLLVSHPLLKTSQAKWESVQT